jgi:hypothetical protein
VSLIENVTGQGQMSTKCNLLAEGRMIVAGSSTQPAVYEFSSLPRIGEKAVININGNTEAFRVIDVTHYASGVDGEAQVLLAVGRTNGS